MADTDHQPAYHDCQYALVSSVPTEILDGDTEVPNGQCLQDKYLIAVQMTNSETRSTDLEVFWATPDQTIEDWVLGRVVLDGSKMMLDPPEIDDRTLPLDSKLHQLGNIIHCRYTQVPRPLNSPEMLTFFQDGEPIASVRDASF